MDTLDRKLTDVKKERRREINRMHSQNGTTLGALLGLGAGAVGLWAGKGDPAYMNIGLLGGMLAGKFVGYGMALRDYVRGSV